MPGKVHHRLAVAVNDELALPARGVGDVEPDPRLQKPRLSGHDVRKRDCHVDDVEPRPGVEAVGREAEGHVERPQPRLLRPHLPQGIRGVVVEAAIDFDFHGRPAAHAGRDQAEEGAGGAAHLWQLAPVDKQPRLVADGENLIERRLEIRTGQNGKRWLREHRLANQVVGRVAAKTGVDELPEFNAERGEGFWCAQTSLLCSARRSLRLAAAGAGGPSQECPRSPCTRPRRPSPPTRPSRQAHQAQTGPSGSWPEPAERYVVPTALRRRQRATQLPGSR